jgi:hypothetical protein
MSDLTYLQATDRCVAALFAPGADFQRADLMRRLALAGEPCVSASVASPPPFSSGIAADGTPIELSVTVGAREPAAVRFLVQPTPNTPDGMPALRRAMTALARDVGCRETLPLMEALLDSLTAGQASHRGNFVAWLGLQQKGSAPPALKVYYNPWAYCLGSPVEWLFAVSRWTPWLAEGLATLGEMFRLLPAAAPMILGLDADARGLDCVKVYFMTNTADPCVVAPLLARWGTATQRRVWALAQTEPGWERRYHAAGTEVDLAMRIRDNEPVTLKVNLFCPHLFSDDAEALRAIAKWAQEGYGLTTELTWLADALERTRVGAGRRFNFVGLGEEKLDVYFRPW